MDADRSAAIEQALGVEPGGEVVWEISPRRPLWRRRLGWLLFAAGLAAMGCLRAFSEALSDASAVLLILTSRAGLAAGLVTGFDTLSSGLPSARCPARRATASAVGIALVTDAAERRIGWHKVEAVAPVYTAADGTGRRRLDRWRLQLGPGHGVDLDATNPAAVSIARAAAVALGTKDLDAESSVALDTETIESALRIAPGELLRIDPPVGGRSRPWHRYRSLTVLLSASGAGAIVCGFVGPFEGHIVTFCAVLVWLAICLVAACVALLPGERRRPWLEHGDCPIIADGHGLTVVDGRRRFNVDWASLAAVERGTVYVDSPLRDRGWLLISDGGFCVAVRDGAPLGDRLVQAAQEVVAARRQGRDLHLPPTAVTAAALSRLTGPTEADEAGLSRTEPTR